MAVIITIIIRISWPVCWFFYLNCLQIISYPQLNPFFHLIWVFTESWPSHFLNVSGIHLSSPSHWLYELLCKSLLIVSYCLSHLPFSFNYSQCDLQEGKKIRVLFNFKPLKNPYCLENEGKTLKPGIWSPLGWHLAYLQSSFILPHVPLALTLAVLKFLLFILNLVFMPTLAHADSFCLEFTWSILCYLIFFLVKMCLLCNCSFM